MGLDELPGRTNYFVGNDQKHWRTNIPTYRRVKYESIYPGIDLVYYGNQEHLEYDFVVAPGADARAIRFALETGDSKSETRGLLPASDQLPVFADSALPAMDSGQSPARNPSSPVAVDAGGDLVMATEAGEVRFRQPIVYQLRPGGGSSQPGVTTDHAWRAAESRRPVDGRYVIRAASPRPKIGDLESYEVAFDLGPYDPSLPVVIDPTLSFSTFLGGANPDTGYAIAVDSSGNVYVAGTTGSSDFPTKNPFQSAPAGAYDVFVTKLDPTGATMVYSTFLGGTGFDQATALALDSSGNVYLAGVTASTSFPTTTGAFQTAFGGGMCGTAPCSDAFVAKIKADGTGLAYATYLGGNNSDSAQGIAVDSSGNAYVAGSTQSVNFPTASPWQASLAGNSDVFVAKVKPDGSGLVYSTYLGGANGDFAQALAVNSSGNAYVTGTTFSTDFPTMNPLRSTNTGLADAFITELSAAGNSLVYSTYLGGSGMDRAFALAVDGAGNAYVAGDTNSADFPVTSGAYQSTLHAGTCGASACSDGFVAKVDPAGATLLYSTYLGGSNLDGITGIAVNAAGNAFVTGITRSADFPLLSPLQSSFGGGTCGVDPCADAFVADLDPTGSAFVYSTYLGGNDVDFGQAIAVDAFDSVYVTGRTASANYPVTFGVVLAARGGDSPSGDAFIARLALPDLPAVALSPQKLTFADQSTGFTSAAQTITLTNAGSAPLTVSSITTSGDFAVQSETCQPSVAAASGTCTINVTFTPTTTGDLTGTLTISTDAAGSPTAVPLAGKGVTPFPAVTLDPTTLTFPATVYNATSDPLSVTLTNSGTAVLTITAIETAGDFAQTNTCPISPETLAIGATCTISVTFTPKGTGNRTGTVTVTSDADNKAGTKTAVTLSGNCLAEFSLSAATPAVTIDRGTDSTTFSITAAGPSSFTDSITLACQNVQTATCSFSPTSLKLGETSTVTVGNLKQVIAPTLGFQVNGTSGTQTGSANLSITFRDFTVTLFPTFDIIASGYSSTFKVTLAPTNGFQGNATLSCSGLPAESTCEFSPSSLSLDGTNPVSAQVTVKTTIRVTVHAPPRNSPPRTPWPTAGIVLFTLAMVSGLARRRRQWRLVLLTGLLLLLTLLAACNDYYYNYSYRGTPAGTFAVGVNAKVGNATNSGTFALTVT